MSMRYQWLTLVLWLFRLSCTTARASTLVPVDTLDDPEGGGLIRALSFKRVVTLPSSEQVSQLTVATSLALSVWNQTNVRPLNGSEDTISNVFDHSTPSIEQWRLQDVMNASHFQIQAVAHSPVGHRAATGGDDGVLRLWRTDVRPWYLISTLPVWNATHASANSSSNSNSIQSVAWHPTGRYLAVAGSHSCRVWHTITWETVPLPVNDAVLASAHVDWSPNGRQLVVGRVIYTLWDEDEMTPNVTDAIQSASPTSALLATTAVVHTCAACTQSTWSPDGQFMATAHGSLVQIVNGASAVVVMDKEPQETLNDTYAAQRLVLQGGLLWNWTVPTAISTDNPVTEGTVQLDTVAWSPDSQWLAVGGTGQASVWVYNARDWTATPRIIATTSGLGVLAMAWSPSPHAWQLAIGTGRVVEMWQVFNESNVVAIPNEQVTWTPTSAPNLDIVVTTASPVATTAAIVANSTLPTPLMTVATLSGISVAAVGLAVVGAVLLFAWRWRVVARTPKRKSAIAAASHQTPDNGKYVPFCSDNGDNDHGIAAAEVDETGDSTTTTDEHCDRIIAFCSPTMESDQSETDRSTMHSSCHGKEDNLRPYVGSVSILVGDV